MSFEFEVEEWSDVARERNSRKGLESLYPDERASRITWTSNYLHTHFTDPQWAVLSLRAILPRQTLSGVQTEDSVESRVVKVTPNHHHHLNTSSLRTSICFCCLLSSNACPEFESICVCDLYVCVGNTRIKYLDV